MLGARGPRPHIPPTINWRKVLVSLDNTAMRFERTLREDKTLTNEQKVPVAASVLVVMALAASIREGLS